MPVVLRTLLHSNSHPSSLSFLRWRSPANKMSHTHLLNSPHCSILKTRTSYNKNLSLRKLMGVFSYAAKLLNKINSIPRPQSSLSHRRLLTTPSHRSPTAKSIDGIAITPDSPLLYGLTDYLILMAEAPFIEIKGHLDPQTPL